MKDQIVNGSGNERLKTTTWQQCMTDTEKEGLSHRLRQTRTRLLLAYRRSPTPLLSLNEGQKSGGGGGGGGGGGVVKVS
ncbi:hypothetical protein Pmani_037740 [Petrolisthes manimaculis]|uniref:Uncharacterized protein n=1 Tax=Petrolisthes manimaculis TaxID=1843537 RepID=A0AAE1TL60_9EUCA|nr:hypothetical protein Pmani_037740 [Petrolisthes manimaculis]